VKASNQKKKKKKKKKRDGHQGVGKVKGKAGPG
jgi:hypothetical protein